MDKNILFVMSKIQDNVEDAETEHGLGRFFRPYSNKPLIDINIVIPMISDRSFTATVCNDLSTLFTVIEKSAYKITLNIEHTRWSINGMQLREDKV